MSKFDERAEQIMSKARTVQAYGNIYELIERNMQWECMQCHDADDEHESTWFTEPDPEYMNEWETAKYSAYKSVLEAIEKLAK